MSGNKWDEEKLKKVLSHMPDIQDTRTKEDLLVRLKEDKRLEETMRKKPARWLPAFVAVAALLVLSLVLTSMLGENEGKMDKASDTSLQRGYNDSKGDFSESAALESEDTEAYWAEDEVNEESLYSTDDLANYFPAVYLNDTKNATVFHIGLVGDQASSVPVTFIIPNSQIEEDLGKLKPTSIELYEEYASLLDEDALGFTDYHPYRGKLSIEGDKIIHTLPYGHEYDIAPGTMGAYIGTLQDTFYGFREIQFQSEDGSTVEFDQVGEPSKPLKLDSGINHYNYYLFIQGDGKEFLSSNFGKTYETLEEALQEMKVKPNDIYSPVIPKTINFTVTPGKGLTYITFTESVDLNSMDPKEALQLVEGMLLTAASFGEQLQFENIVQTEWNKFNFSKPMEIPIGPNQLPFLLK